MWEMFESQDSLHVFEEFFGIQYLLYNQNKVSQINNL